jgi:predicted TIM-barrel fold metal-dependent hydrolase
MVVDCHQHLDPENFPVNDVIRQMDENGINRIALMAAVCGTIPEPSQALLKALRFSLKKSWLRPLVKKSITRFTENGDLKIPSALVRIIKTPDNEPVFNMAEAFPERFLAWCMVRPDSGTDPAAEYERWKDHPACVGVKAHPFWHRFSLDKLIPVAEKLVEKKAPLIVHLGFDGHGDILAFSNRIPELKIILAHAAFPGYVDTWKIIRNRKNILVDLSATSYVDEGTIREVTDYLGAERCLFGTDGPFGSHSSSGGFDMGVIKRRIEKIIPDQGKKRMILGENFMNFINVNRQAS